MMWLSRIKTKKISQHIEQQIVIEQEEEEDFLLLFINIDMAQHTHVQLFIISSKANYDYQ